MLYTTPANRSGRRSRRGATTLELACILPVLLTMLLGTIDVARVMYAYGTVSEAARAGARYAMVHGARSGSPTGPSANNTNVADVVKANALALDPTYLTVTSSWGNGSNKASNPVTVTATYTCYLGIGQLVGLSSVTVRGSTTAEITY
jgi:Flp pilus assembly protein TadG